jgi:hypothetical protein
MTFRDLPPDLRDRSLTDRRLAADVIDLIVGDEDRARGCIGLMLCDGLDRGLQPIVISEVPENASSDGLRQLLELVLPVVAEDGGSVLVGRGRRRGVEPNDLDREWHQAAIDCCATAGVRLIGFHVATGDGIFTLPEPLTAVS